MKYTITTILIILSLFSVGQTYRIDSIRALDKLKIESRLTSKKIYISVTERSNVPASSHLFRNAFGEIREMDLVETIAESDFIFDCTILGNKDASTCIFSIYDSKSGKFVSSTKIVRSSDFEEMEIYRTRKDYHQKVIEKCILKSALPIIRAINRKPNERLPKIKGNSNIFDVVVLNDVKYAEGLEKSSSFSTKLLYSKKQKLLEEIEKGINKLQFHGAQRYAPLVIITEWFGLDNKSAIGFKADCYKNPKQE